MAVSGSARQPGEGALAPDVGQIAAAADEERPHRRLSPRLDLAVNVWCCAVSLFVLRQVFWPLDQGRQYYLVLFLGFTLSLVFVCYRARARRTADLATTDDPGPLDWFLASVALIVGLYPALPIPAYDLGFGGCRHDLVSRLHVDGALRGLVRHALR